MKSLALRAIDTAKTFGASYADIRVIRLNTENIALTNGAVSNLNQGDTLGFGVRVIVDGAWGFASSNEVNGMEIDRVAALAVQIAKTSARVKREGVRLAPVKAIRDVWQTPIQTDPFRVPLEQKLALLSEVDAILRKDKRVARAQSQMSFRREHQIFASSEGALIEQTLYRSGGGFSAFAVGNGDMQVRSYPCSFGGQHKSMGYEIIPAMDFVGNADRVRDEACALLTADECPEVKTDLILDPTQLMLQIHESVGHATELDRVLGLEADFAGMSFCTREKLDDFRYGSDIVNLVADSTVPTGLATIGYDDDGVQAQRWHIVHEGRFAGYHTNREFAHTVNDDMSRGANRADGYENIPMIRITNLSLMPGDWQFDNLISDTKDGIYMATNRCWSIDQMRLNFQFGCEIAWEIKNGKQTRMLKNPNYQGITPEFWRSCDAICDQDHWDLWGIYNCGKGQPMQVAEMSHGSSPARFKNVTIGVRG